jgi:hypothetical protein
VKKLLSILVLVVMTFVLVTVVSASSAATTSEIFYLVFGGPDDTYTFGVEKARGAGDLTVDTRDCCIVGDRWRVDLMPNQPSDPKDQVAGVGDGSTGDFTGDATSHPWIGGNVVVSYDSGVDRFPAGMWVRFQYTKDPGVFIFTSPLPAARPESEAPPGGENYR